MTTAQGVRNRLEASGYVVHEDEHDPGTLRAYWTLTPVERLVGLFIIRDERMSYAEFGPEPPIVFWPDDSGNVYDNKLAALYTRIGRYRA